MKKLVLAIVYFMLSPVAFANPTAVCSGPDSVIGGDQLPAPYHYHVRKSYDYQDHNLERASISWDFSGEGCASATPPPTLKGQWSRYVTFNDNPYEPLFCTITVAVTDGSTSTCSINVRVSPHCETSDDPDCIEIQHEK